MRGAKYRIWVQLLLTIAAALVVVWSGVIAWQAYAYREAALKQAEDYSLSMHSATMAGLTGMMVTGTVAQRDVFLDQIKQLGTIRDVRVLRGDSVIQAFGPGNDKDDHQPDAAEQWVLKNGQPLVRVETDAQGEYLRAIRPALAKPNYLGKNCMQCHQVPENTVLGVVGMKVSLEKVNAELADQRFKSILMAIITSIPVLMLIYPFIQRVVARPLAQGVEVAKGIAGGDLTQSITVDSQNEIGELQQSLKDMNDSLVKVVGQVRTGTDMIYQAASEIASGNADLSERTEAQAGALDQTAVSMRELTSMVNQNADSARQANQLVQAASEVALKGGAVVSEAVDKMEAINVASSRIVDIIGVIDSIAFQTNILALNAAVEAARAGEQGRGFAVVASEVRSLAQRSATAAKEIKQLIDASVDQVGAGRTLVHQAGSTMNDIVASIHQVTDIMGSIVTASAEQTTGIERINGVMSELNDVTHQNAAMVEQASAAAKSLQDQAAHLEELVDVFKLAHSGGSAQRA